MRNKQKGIKKQRDKERCLTLFKSVGKIAFSFCQAFVDVQVSRGIKIFSCKELAFISFEN
jgi:hypothetical protein